MHSTGQFSVIFLLSLVRFVSTQNLSSVVKTTYGDVQGKIEMIETYQTTTFKGIPFAKPPVGSLRFKKPKKPTSWSGVRNTTAFGPSCRQSGNGVLLSSVPESEDCLYLNIFIPQTLETALKSPKAVMVWIHGGGWVNGNSNLYEANLLASMQDVIVVTFNYRLGLLGFMSSPDGVFPANVGLFDQHAAMKWVKENIINFGGDASRITIFGQSAGADSVLNHYVSPLSQDLFNRAIIQSSPYVRFLITKEVQYKIVQSGATAECGNMVQPQQLMECLLKLTADQVIAISDRVRAMSYRFITVDGEFLTDEPRKLLFQGKFDKTKEVIIGFTSGDGDISIKWVTEGFTWDELITQGISQRLAKNQIQKLIMYYFNTIPKNSVIMNNLVYQHYISCQDKLVDIARGTLEMATDAVFTVVPFKVASLISMNGGKVYLYELGEGLSVTRVPNQMLNVVGHGDDVYFLFGFVYDLLSRNIPVIGTDIVMTRHLMGTFTEFAKTGNAVYVTGTNQVVPWKPFTELNKEFLYFSANMDINSTRPWAMRDHSMMKNPELWSQVMEGIYNMDTCDPYMGSVSPTPNNAITGTLPSMTVVLLTASVTSILMFFGQM